MKPKHTPGPWHVTSMTLNLVVVGANGGAVARTDYAGTLDEDNARLIAAAPEMLDALERLLSVIEKRFGSASLDGTMMIARAAIAKATGGK